MRLAFRAAPTRRGAARARRARRPPTRTARPSGRRHRAARRRRLHAGDPARLPRRRPPDLRHEPRHASASCSTSTSRSGLRGADRRGQPRSTSTRCGCAPASARRRGRRRRSASTRSRCFRETRQAAALSIAIDGVVPHAGAGLRRHPGRHAGRQHRLQPLRARADHPARRQSPGADPDQPVPPPPLARRPPALPAPASSIDVLDPASARSAPSPTSPRSATSRASRSGRTATSPARLLFDPEHNLEERILKEQFVP